LELYPLCINYNDGVQLWNFGKICWNEIPEEPCPQWGPLCQWAGAVDIVNLILTCCATANVFYLIFKFFLGYRKIFQRKIPYERYRKREKYFLNLPISCSLMVFI
jgi:hypothetical protein